MSIISMSFHQHWLLRKLTHLEPINVNVIDYLQAKLSAKGLQNQLLSILDFLCKIEMEEKERNYIYKCMTLRGTKHILIAKCFQQGWKDGCWCFLYGRMNGGGRRYEYELGAWRSIFSKVILCACLPAAHLLFSNKKFSEDAVSHFPYFNFI